MATKYSVTRPSYQSVLFQDNRTTNQLTSYVQPAKQAQATKVTHFYPYPQVANLFLQCGQLGCYVVQVTAYFMHDRSIGDRGMAYYAQPECCTFM